MIKAKDIPITKTVKPNATIKLNKGISGIISSVKSGNNKHAPQNTQNE